MTFRQLTHHTDQKTKEDTIREYSGRGIEEQVEEPGKAHVREDAKPSSSPDRTDATVHITSVEDPQETLRPDARIKVEQHQPTNTCHQSRNLARENASLKTKLETKRGETTKRLGDLQGIIKRLRGEQEELWASREVEKKGLL